MKGGVGKTTLAANITRALADQKQRRILLIDADAQCNFSQVFYDDDFIEGASRSLYQAFDTKTRPLFAGELKNTIYPRPDRLSPKGSIIDFITGSFDTFELNAIANAARRSGAAARFMSFIDQAKKEYDLIVIDTNPSATFVTMQALENSNFLVGPITFDAFSLQGIHLVVHQMVAIHHKLGRQAPKPRSLVLARGSSRLTGLINGGKWHVTMAEGISKEGVAEEEAVEESLLPNLLPT